jgi:hypothetical protein
MNIEKKSPLKSAPLRSAGQSIQDRQIELLNDKLVAPAFLIAFFLGITLFEWLRTLRPTDPNPALYSLLLLLSVGFFVYRLLTLRSELMRLRLAKEGERAASCSTRCAPTATRCSTTCWARASIWSTS